MQMSTQEFIYRRNVLNYLKQLREGPDQDRRALLLMRLAEEAAKARAAGWTLFLG